MLADVSSDKYQVEYRADAFGVAKILFLIEWKNLNIFGCFNKLMIATIRIVVLTPKWPLCRHLILPEFGANLPPHWTGARKIMR